jgi:hypothetical protein
MNMTRILAPALLTAGILGGALGLATTASAETPAVPDQNEHSLRVAPDHSIDAPAIPHIGGSRILHPHQHGGIN